MRAYRYLQLVVLLMGAIGLASPVCAASKGAENDVRIRMSIPRGGNALNPGYVSDRMLETCGEDALFNVIIENTSTRRLAFFTDGNSCGDGTLSFEITLPDGKKTQAKRVITGYTANTPQVVFLDPGECWVRAVKYDSAGSGWQGWPKLVRGNNVVMTIRAVLEQHPHKSSRMKELWNGKAVSKSMRTRFGMY